MNPRILEIVGQFMVGDGVTCVVVPRRHMLLWRDALPWQLWRAIVQWCADRPNATIVAGLVEALLGLRLILRANRRS